MRASFDKFLHPRSVAIIGASPKHGSPRNTLIRNLLKHGFAGKIYPVSQSNTVIEGLEAFRSILNLPEVPDVALIITPASTVPDVVMECGSFGIEHVIVYSSGFEEVGTGGKEIAQRLRQAAHKNGIALIGPNCQGVWSMRHKAMLTFSPAVLNATEPLRSAPIAIVSQSGAIAGAMGGALQRAGMGYSYIVSVGNETCLDTLDVLDEIINQDDVRVVALYVEALADASRLLYIAERARARNVQLVMLKTGRSEIGRQATASHTGKMASSYAIYADLLEQAGVLCLDSLQNTIAALEFLAFLPHPRDSDDDGAGISVLSSSGGAGALLADHASELDLPMAKFSAHTTDTLKHILPDFARTENPIDLTGQINTDRALFRNVCEIVVADSHTQAVVVQLASSGRAYMQENFEVFKTLAREVPIIVSFIGETMEPEVRQQFRDHGIVLSPDPSVSMHALSWLYKRQKWFMLPDCPTQQCGAPTTPPLGWEATMHYLEMCGVDPVSSVIVGPEHCAATACAVLRPPFAVKALPDDAEHKTELGLLRLNVRSFGEVDEAISELRALLGKPGASILVQEMADKGVEAMLACISGTDFGPVLVIGSGGTEVELERDIAHVALPTSAQQVERALRRLKLWSRLSGFRGKAAADTEAFIRAAVRFGNQFLDTPQLVECEINPVIVLPRGQGLVAVDALFIANAESAHDVSLTRQYAGHDIQSPAQRDECNC